MRWRLQPLILRGVPGVHAPVDVAPYVDLLDRAIADLQITAEEWIELWAVAEELGLDSARVARAHTEFINALIDAALADLVITDEEYDQLSRAAALLGVDPAVIARRTDEYRSARSEVVVSAGMRVCFTGAAVDAPRPNDRTLAPRRPRKVPWVRTDQQRNEERLRSARRCGPRLAVRQGQQGAQVRHPDRVRRGLPRCS